MWAPAVERGRGENGWADGLTGGALRAGLGPPTKTSVERLLEPGLAASVAASVDGGAGTGRGRPFSRTLNGLGASDPSPSRGSGWRVEGLVCRCRGCRVLCPIRDCPGCWGAAAVVVSGQDSAMVTQGVGWGLLWAGYRLRPGAVAEVKSVAHGADGALGPALNASPGRRRGPESSFSVSFRLCVYGSGAIRG